MSQAYFLYQNRKGNVRITRTLLEINTIQYQIRNIDSIRRITIEPDNTQASNCILLGFFVLIFATLLTSVELFLIGSAAVVLGFAWLSSLSTQYSLKIVTTGGMSFSYDSENLQEIADMQAALERAISLLL